jgi:methanogenesis imperfect marker protein 11
MADPGGDLIEVVEFYECIGGAQWVRRHYAQSPIVASARSVGGTTRYVLRAGAAPLDLEGSRFPPGIPGPAGGGGVNSVADRGMGGGGGGAAACRARAGGVIGADCDESGGGKVAGSTIRLPRRERVIIGVDDTDTPEAGATWTLVHNIAKAVADDASVYLSHTIVQLFPVPFRTKNCVACAVEFASTDPDGLVGRFADLLRRHTLSEETGMAVHIGFDPSPLRAYGEAVKRGQVSRADLDAVSGHVRVVMDGRGLIGAVAAIPFYTDFEEALALWTG